MLLPGRSRRLVAVVAGGSGVGGGGCPARARIEVSGWNVATQIVAVAAA